METFENSMGAYRYVAGIPPYSAGVRADDDHVIVRTVLSARTSWHDGFSLIDSVLTQAGRPSQALCAVELRCPAAHSFDGFGSFNDDYRQALDERAILLDGGINPVARTNVAPAMPGLDVASDTELYAFSFTMPRVAARTEDDVRPSFVIAGAGDLGDQSDLRPEAIVGGAQDWQASGQERASAVLDEIEARLRALDVTWAETDTVVTYSVERIGAVIESTVLPRLGPAMRRGVHWVHARPPIEGLRFEMDARGGTIERRGGLPQCRLGRPVAHDCRHGQLLDLVQKPCESLLVNDVARQQLRDCGLQVTAQRLAVVQAVSAHPHATTDELVDAVRSNIGSVSRQAVYDTLNVFVEKNLIRRIQPAGSVARYEDRVGDNHHHLICRGCGLTFDIDCAVGTTPCLTADDDHGFEIDEAEVVYWGRCPSCRNR